MQIGEFAKLCKTKISVLRHYDKEGLLRPDYIDRFTGYRYYSKEQAEVFLKISALKDAGFSLSEIRKILSKEHAPLEISLHFERKKAELEETLLRLSKAKKLLYSSLCDEKLDISETFKGMRAQLFCKAPVDFDSVCERLDVSISCNGYQRISPFEMEVRSGGGYTVGCSVLKLSAKVKPLHENGDIPFEDDPAVVGKWQVAGEFAVREDFFSGKHFGERDERRSIDTLYFLPGGEEYWCFSWTRGKLIIRRGGGDCSVNAYTVETVGSQRYMFVELKSYSFRRGGKETVLVLRQLDRISYKKEELARRDCMELPFRDDPQVLGLWRSCGFVFEKDSFEPCEKCPYELIYSSLEFLSGGEVKSTFSGGNTVSSRNMQEWTKGYLLRKWTSSACAYEIRNIGGRDYLFLEWKSGDYIFGGMDTNYYVFVRER